MQALVYIFLQRIIHKAMPRYASLACKNWALNAYSKMGTQPRVIGPDMARMGGTFVQNFDKNWVEALL